MFKNGGFFNIGTSSAVNDVGSTSNTFIPVIIAAVLPIITQLLLSFFSSKIERRNLYSVTEMQSLNTDKFSLEHQKNIKSIIEISTEGLIKKFFRNRLNAYIFQTLLTIISCFSLAILSILIFTKNCYTNTAKVWYCGDSDGISEPGDLSAITLDQIFVYHDIFGLLMWLNVIIWGFILFSFIAHSTFFNLLSGASGLSFGILYGLYFDFKTFKLEEFDNLNKVFHSDKNWKKKTKKLLKIGFIIGFIIIAAIVVTIGFEVFKKIEPIFSDFYVGNDIIATLVLFVVGVIFSIGAVKNFRFTISLLFSLDKTSVENIYKKDYFYHHITYAYKASNTTHLISSLSIEEISILLYEDYSSIYFETDQEKVLLSNLIRRLKSLLSQKVGVNFIDYSLEEIVYLCIRENFKAEKIETRSSDFSPDLVLIYKDDNKSEKLHKILGKCHSLHAGEPNFVCRKIET